MAYKVVDLFAGAGGLSKGFLLANDELTKQNSYAIYAFVEKNPAARETYKRNHPDVIEYEDVTSVDYKQLIAKCGKIDVVIGGPPCQGFSNANRQHNELVNMNNQLVKEYVRAIRELNPRAFIMENVQMLKSDVHVFFYTKEDKHSGELEKYNIDLKDISLELLSETLSHQIFGGTKELSFKDISKLKLSSSTISIINNLKRYLKNPDKFRHTFLKYRTKISKFNDELKILSKKSNSKRAFSLYKNLFEKLEKYSQSKSNSDNDLFQLIKEVSELQQFIKNVEELENKRIDYKLENLKGIHVSLKTYSVCEYLKKILSASENNYTINAGILNAAEFGAPQKRQRFILIGVKNAKDREVQLPKGSITEKNFRTVKDAIGDLEYVQVQYDVSADGIKRIRSPGRRSDLQKLLRDSDVINNHICTKTRDIALARFAMLKQGQNFHDLSEDMKINTYTDVTRTQNTIYQRLAYDKPSGTVLNVRKSMWIHPTLDRAISIREAARLQTFPDSFVFCGKKDEQYQQIGNAVPPILGKALALHLNNLIKKSTN